MDELRLQDSKNWADFVVDELIKRERKEYICEGMWSPSGHFHIGNARPEIFTPYSVVLALENRGYKAKQNFVIDDFDAIRKIPSDLGISKENEKEFLGQPYALAPSPIPGYKNWAEAFVAPLKDVINEFGVKLHISSAYETYKSGKLNDIISFSLDHAAEIAQTWKRISGSEKSESFLPVQLFCDCCGKLFYTEAFQWDGKEVSYKCNNCNYEGKKSPFNGNAKLHWRVHWCAFWILNKVDFESAGKDHFSKGGSVDVGQALMRDVFKKPAPYQIPTEFIQISGTKMSGSIGNVITLQMWLEVASPELFRFLNLSHKPNKVIEFNLRDNSFILLNDRYERAERIYYGVEKAENEKVQNQLSRAYELSCLKKPQPTFFGQLPFNIAIQLCQIFDPEKDFEKIINFLVESNHYSSTIPAEEQRKIKLKLKRAKNWVEKYAPSHHKFNFIEVTPPEAKALVDSKLKKCISELYSFLQKRVSAEEIQKQIFNIAKSNSVQPKDFFVFLYLALLGKKEGPKIGTLILAIGKERVLSRLAEFTN